MGIMLLLVMLQDVVYVSQLVKNAQAVGQEESGC